MNIHPVEVSRCWQLDNMQPNEMFFTNGKRFNRQAVETHFKFILREGSTPWWDTIHMPCLFKSTNSVHFTQIIWKLIDIVSTYIGIKILWFAGLFNVWHRKPQCRWNNGAVLSNLHLSIRAAILLHRSSCH